MIRDQRREDIFVSVCFADVWPSESYLAELANLSKALTAKYRYCEILVVAFAGATVDYQPLISQVANVRLLMVRPGTPFYRRRSAVASEAIGDIVVLASIDEQPTINIIEMIELADVKGSIVIGRRSKAGLMNPTLRALGRSGGFRVDMRDMLTACYPRALLSKLLTHPDRQLALRFPPADASLPVIWQPGCEGCDRSRSFRELGRRLSMVHKLLVSSAPRVLALVSLLSLLVVFVALAFAIYVVVVWSILATIQPGWFTTSLVLSLTAAFLGGAVFGLTIGLQKVIESLSGDQIDEIVDERGSVDMFDQAMKELNVEISADPSIIEISPNRAKARGAE